MTPIDLLKLMRECGYNSEEVHPEAYRKFSYATLAARLSTERDSLLIRVERAEAALRELELARTGNASLDWIRALAPGTVFLSGDVPGEDRKVAFNAVSYSKLCGTIEKLGYGKYRRAALPATEAK